MTDHPPAPPPPRFWLCLTGISGAIAVLMGAAGSHWVASPDDAARVVTASQFQLMHTLLLLILALAPACALNRSWKNASMTCLLAGITLFSGSLYARALLAAASAPAPAGGLLLIAGWICLAIAGVRRNQGS